MKMWITSCGLPGLDKSRHWWHSKPTIMWAQVFWPYLICIHISDQVSMMLLFLPLQTILKNLISLPCIFNLEAKCSYMKNRVWKVILSCPKKILGITFVSMYFFNHRMKCFNCRVLMSWLWDAQLCWRIVSLRWEQPASNISEDFGWQ